MNLGARVQHMPAEGKKTQAGLIFPGPRNGNVHNSESEIGSGSPMSLGLCIMILCRN